MTEPRWYLMKTMLGCSPGHDVNRRILYHDDIPVVVFNQRMAEWHPDDQRALSKLCDYLNRTERTLVTHPYGIRWDDLRALVHKCEAEGLEAEIDAVSWWYPTSTIAIAVRKRRMKP